MRQRAARNHRSLQGELMAIIEAALVKTVPMVPVPTPGAQDVVVGYGAGGYPIVRKGWTTVQQVAAELRALCRGCVKTLTKIFGQKIDRLERSTSDDRHLGNGFGTPNFSASLDNFEFLHRLCPEPVTDAPLGVDIIREDRDSR